MRILYIHNFYQQFGGVDAVVRNEIRFLRTNGQDLFLLTRHGKEIADFGLLRKAALPANTVFSNAMYRKTRKAIASFKPDVAYVHNVLPLLSPSVYKALFRARVPTVQSLDDFRLLCPSAWFFTHGRICERCKNGHYTHAALLRCYRRSLLLSTTYALAVRSARRRLLKKIHTFVCPSEFVRRKYIEADFPEAGLKVRPFSVEMPPGPPPSKHGEYVLFLGRLSPEKGVWQLVKALESQKDIPLRIAGTGPEEKKLQKYIRRKKLQHIELTGFLEEKQKWDAIRNCAMLVAPSECYESFGMMVIEAFAAGKAVIVPDTGSLPDIVEHGVNGLCFRRADHNDLMTKIKMLYDDPSRSIEMGRRGREAAATDYSPAREYDQLMDILARAAKTS
jgi:glycosyltransferase involved in cell wall biosynthesis